MHGTKRITLALATAALLPLAACDGDSTGSGDGRTGEVRFTYRGDESGSFSARGRVTPSNVESGTYAAGTVEEGGVLVYAQEGQAGDTYDGIILALQDAEEGSITCRVQDEDCGFFASFVLGQNDDAETSDALYFATSGTVTITDIDDDRVRGTFSLSMDGFAGIEGDDSSVEVSSGTFDVPLLDDSSIPISRAPARPALPRN